MISVNSTAGAAAFLNETVKFVCEAYKKRSPGTKSERASLEYFAKILRNSADEVKVERFILHPHAYNGTLIIGGVCGLLSAVLSVLAATAGTVRLAGILSFIFLCISLIMTIVEFVFCRQVFDVLFPRRISKNVYAVRKSSEQAQQRIIFSAHADSPKELLLSSKSLKRFNRLLLLVYACATVISYIITAIYLFSGCPPIKGGWIVYPVVLCIFVPVFVLILFYRKHGKTVDGACSALSGCAVSCAVLDNMASSGRRLRNTEVCCLITGGYNAGCRGAAAFVKAHKDELKDIPTYVIPIGSVSAGGHFTVCSLDRNATLHNDMDCAEMIIRAARETGTDVAHSDLTFRCTDAVPFSNAGISACTVEAGEGVHGSPAETKADNYKCFSPSAAQSVLEICLACMRKYDANLQDANQNK